MRASEPNRDDRDEQATAHAVAPLSASLTPEQATLWRVQGFGQRVSELQAAAGVIPTVAVEVIADLVDFVARGGDTLARAIGPGEGALDMAMAYAQGRAYADDVVGRRIRAYEADERRAAAISIERHAAEVTARHNARWSMLGQFVEEWRGPFGGEAA